MLIPGLGDGLLGGLLGGAAGGCVPSSSAEALHRAVTQQQLQAQLGAQQQQRMPDYALQQQCSQSAMNAMLGLGMMNSCFGQTNGIRGISRPVWKKPTARPRVESVRERNARFLREATADLDRIAPNS